MGQALDDSPGHSHPRRERIRSVMLPVSFWLAVGVALLALSVSLPARWARVGVGVAEMALSFVAMSLAVLGAIFLPVWAGNARAATINVLSAAIFVLFAGAIEGSLTGVSMARSGKLIALLGAFATIWFLAANRPQARRIVWTAILIGTVGLAVATFLRAESSSGQDLRSTFLHFGLLDWIR